MPPFEGHVLDVRLAGFADPQAIQPEQHREGGVGTVEPFGGEEESAELASVESALLRRMDLRAANVLSRVGPDAAIDVSEAGETAGGREAPVDGRGGQGALLRG